MAAAHDAGPGSRVSRVTAVTGSPERYVSRYGDVGPGRPSDAVTERYVSRYGDVGPGQPGDAVTGSPASQSRVCPGCGKVFFPSGRETYHSAACRQRAYRARQARPRQARGQSPTGSLTEHSMYTCPDCGEQYFGQRWCDSCQRPCRRVGFAFECGCGEAHLLEEVLAEFGIQLDETALPVKLRPSAARRKGPA